MTVDRPRDLPLAELRTSIEATHSSERCWTTARTDAACEVFESRDAASAAVFVKQFSESDSANPEHIAELLSRFRRAVHARRAPERFYAVPRLISFGRNPAYIAYEWVSGDLLSTKLSERAARPAEFDWIIAAARGAGRALAQLHIDARTDSTHWLPVERPRWSRPLVLTKTIPNRPSAAITDVGPWNLIQRDGLPPVFIDVDIKRRREVEFDAARFASALFDRSHWLPWRSAHDVLGAFVGGYSEASDKPVNRWLIILSASIDGLTHNVTRLRRSGRGGGDRRWILGRLGASLTVIPIAVAKGLRARGRSPYGIRA